MTPEQIIENNILIAEFMGWETKDIKQMVLLYDYSPNRDWNQLMPVVEKIENLHECSDVLLFPAGCSISYNEGAGKVFTCSYDRDTKIEAVYEACTAFVKWYNQNQGGN